MNNILKAFLFVIALTALSACDRFGGGSDDAMSEEGAEWQELEQEVITPDE